MDIANIDDIKELKAMAYDQIAAREVAEQNLRVINQRIQELSTPPPATEEE